MYTRRRRGRVVGLALAVGLGVGGFGLRAGPPPQASALRQALQADPLTAPFPVQVDVVDGRYVLSGRVGSKQAHDAVVRTALRLGIVARDDLVIDTSEAYRAAAENRWNGTAVPHPAPLPWYWYVYPPPLFGRIDDPFLGFEPPVVSYPPWWGAVAAREPLDLGAIDAALTPAADARATGQVNVPSGSVLLTLDPRGVAILRGTVPTEAQKNEIERKVATAPGVNQVVNQLQVDPKARSIAGTESPPPPPRPAGPRAPVPAPPVPEFPGAAAAADDPLARRVREALSRRPALTGLVLSATGRDGVVTLTGAVPTAYEAMLAYRAAQQTPGVREVIDRLSFMPPDVDQPNPLRERARPEDLVPYLTSHLRRQLGDLAHLDRIEVHADTLEIHGTIARADDGPRVEAALRSVALLRGFRIEPHFLVD